MKNCYAKYRWIGFLKRVYIIDKNNKIRLFFTNFDYKFPLYFFKRKDKY